MKTITKLVLAATVAISGNSAATMASAATVIFNPGVFGTPASFTLVADFNTAASQNIVSGTNFIFPTGSIPYRAAALPGNETPYLAVLSGGVANIAFNSDVRSFSFDYSTVDTFNTLTINYADGGFENVSGDDILLGGLPSGSVSGSFIINGDGRLIAGLSLATSDNSFEVDNLSTSQQLAAVPETATWGMMIAGFGIMGAGLRSRRRSTKVAFA
jgi:hypothetical protein